MTGWFPQEHCDKFEASCNIIFDKLSQSCRKLRLPVGLEMCDISESYVGGFWQELETLVGNDPFIRAVFEPLWRDKIYHAFFSISQTLSSAIASLERSTNLQRFLDRFMKDIKTSSHDDPGIFCDICDNLIYRCKAQRTIAVYWRRAMSDPHYKMCRVRLAKEFSQM